VLVAGGYDFSPDIEKNRWRKYFEITCFLTVIPTRKNLSTGKSLYIKIYRL